MSAFINGPFKARNNGSYWQIDDKNGIQVGDACAATVDGYDDNGEIKKDWERGEAVATMLAAAPELLEALKAILAACESDCGVPSDDDGDDEPVGGGLDHEGNPDPMALTFGHMRRAARVIAKAEGRT